jgi:hypothetical protein
MHTFCSSDFRYCTNAVRLDSHEPNLLNSDHFFLTGEYGKPAIVDKENLSPEEQAKYDVGWQNNAFNEYASDKISLHRSLPDYRHPQYVRTLYF